MNSGCIDPDSFRKIVTLIFVFIIYMPLFFCFHYIKRLPVIKPKAFIRTESCSQSQILISIDLFVFKCSVFIVSGISEICSVFIISVQKISFVSPVSGKIIHFLNFTVFILIGLIVKQFVIFIIGAAVYELIFVIVLIYIRLRLAILFNSLFDKIASQIIFCCE